MSLSVVLGLEFVVVGQLVSGLDIDLAIDEYPLLSSRCRHDLPEAVGTTAVIDEAGIASELGHGIKPSCTCVEVLARKYPRWVASTTHSSSMRNM